MKRLAALLLAGCAGTASAGSLQECSRADDREHLVPCLRGVREAATNEMLERFLDVDQALTALGEEALERARELLKQSQRAFERYVFEHCNGAQSMMSAGSEAAMLACETDLLRQRAHALQDLEIATAGRQ